MREVRPPGPPWTPLTVAVTPAGRACFYLCDELARLPVRAVTKVQDNKSDPNIETGTFGLFSTCEQEMRSGVVSRGVPLLFFVTRPRGSLRVLTGYYRVGWFTEGVLRRRTRDYSLAAAEARFIAPISLTELPGPVATTLMRPWRLQVSLDAVQARLLLDLIDRRPDRTADYLGEIDRMERINLVHSGYRYPTWRKAEPWSWSDASAYLAEAADDPAALGIRNSSPSGWWKCLACDGSSANRALLKLCPHCKEPGGLRPAPAPALSTMET